MAIRKFGTGKILEEGKDSPDPIVKEAAKEWTDEDSRELAQENEEK